MAYRPIALSELATAGAGPVRPSITSNARSEAEPFAVPQAAQADQARKTASAGCQ